MVHLHEFVELEDVILGRALPELLEIGFDFGAVIRLVAMTRDGDGAAGNQQIVANCAKVGP